MKLKLAVRILAISSFTVLLLTLTNIIQNPSAPRSFQSTRSANTISPSNPTHTENKEDSHMSTNVPSPNSPDLPSKDLDLRNLQDINITISNEENPSGSTPDASSSIGTPVNIDFNKEMNALFGDSQDEEAYNHTYWISPSRASSSQLVQGALAFGSQAVIDIALRQGRIPQVNPVYYVSELVTARYRKYEHGATYLLQAKMVNSDYKRVDADMTVHYDYTEEQYKLYYYKYRSYNFTRKELYANNNGTNLTSNFFTVGPDYIAQNQAIQNALAYGVKDVLDKAVRQGEIEDGSVSFELSSDVISASFGVFGDGITYAFNLNMTSIDSGYMLANMTVSYKDTAQAFNVDSYMYMVVTDGDGDHGV